MLGQVHLLSALAALGCGAGVLLRKKGTPSHRRLGYAYTCAMVTPNATALGIYRLFHAWGPFHWLALLSLASVAAGVFTARRRRPGWPVRHARLMAGSYIGLVAAAAAEIAVRVPLGLPRTGRNFGFWFLAPRFRSLWWASSGFPSGCALMPPRKRARDSS